MRDVAFWGKSSESEGEDSEMESIYAPKRLSSLSKHNPLPDVEPRAAKHSNSKYRSEGTPIVRDKQDHGKTRTQGENLVDTRLVVPRPRDHPRTTTPYTANSEPKKPESASDTEDDESSLESSGAANDYRPRNRTAEDHNAQLKAIVNTRWHPLSKVDQQAYLEKCSQGWRCFYCQILDLSGGCISQVSRYNCPATIRRGVPCHIAFYEKEQCTYRWKKLPSRKKRTHKTFEDVYFVICGRGNPETEQQFLKQMSQKRDRCLNCILSTKTTKRGDHCKMQRLAKPESQGEEFLKICTKCARNQHDCMVSIPMNSGVNGEPIRYGLGRVMIGGVEELGPRFHNPPNLETPVAPREPQGPGKPLCAPTMAIHPGPCGDGELAKTPKVKPSKSPGIHHARSTIAATPLPVQLLKRAISMPESRGRNPGEPLIAGAASERRKQHRSDESPSDIQTGAGKKREHSPTITAQERSLKSKVRRLPTYSSQLSFVDQLKNGYSARPVEYADPKPEPSTVIQRQYQY